ncbi:hypothetical protein [Rufibacter roseus]|uniref:Uncharacterized protein n=1 Tax=Rufibacter roseus TaxID=1567108 RepID=A0ABW2DMA4_9BACT|nr:hypothetical protein [Rufibacter roseus]
MRATKTFRSGFLVQLVFVNLLILALAIGILKFSMANTPQAQGLSGFKPNQNNFVYSPITISKFKSIVDSININFEKSEVNLQYFSKPQAKAHYVYLNSGNVREAIRDMEQNLPFKEFLRKYPSAKVLPELLVLKERVSDIYGNSQIKFRAVSFNEEHARSFTRENLPEVYNRPLKGKYLWQHYPKTDYSQETLEAFYLVEEFQPKRLPVTYTRMLQYSNSLVDTTAQIFYSDAKDYGYNPYEKLPSKDAILQFLQYINWKTSKPEYTINNQLDEKGLKILVQRINEWEVNRFKIIDQSIATTAKFKTLLTNALTQSITTGKSTSEFEEYVAKYHSPEAALELKRKRVVTRTCGYGPDEHIQNIAKLSAQTGDWEIFIRALLDILDERYIKMSNGSYSFAARRTYVYELEVLNINVLNLLLGISLQIENPSQNHYFGNIHRISSAIAESRFAPQFEQQLLNMIKDSQLDDYNRVVMIDLFMNYTNNLEDEKRKEANKTMLQAAAQKLPSYLSTPKWN